jgi:uncharacterized protein (TIGR02246 family)
MMEAAVQGRSSTPRMPVLTLFQEVAMSASLSKEITSLDSSDLATDRLDLQELVSRYNQAIDHYDSHAWADVFEEDGVLIVNGEVRARGRNELFQYVERRRVAGTPKLRHWATNIVVDVRGDEATLKLYVMAFNIAAGLEAPYVMGEYEDEAVRRNGRWRFRVRRLTVVAGQSSTGN